VPWGVAMPSPPKAWAAEAFEGRDWRQRSRAPDWILQMLEAAGMNSARPLHSHRSPDRVGTSSDRPVHARQIGSSSEAWELAATEAAVEGRRAVLG